MNLRWEFQPFVREECNEMETATRNAERERGREEGGMLVNGGREKQAAAGGGNIDTFRR